MSAIFKREWKSMFSGMLGYALCAAYVLVGGLYFWVYNLLNLYPDFGYTLYGTTFAMLVFIPILTMRSLAEERRSHTDQLLLTAPVGVPSLVAGKYLAMAAVFTVPVAILGLCPLVMRLYGTVSLPKAYGALLGYWLLGCAGIAIGLFFSGLTDSPIIAALSTFGVLLLSYLMPGIQSLFAVGSLLALGVFGLLAALAGLLAGIRSRSLMLGMLVFLALCAALLALYALRSATLTSAFTALLGALGLFTPFENFIYGIFSIPAVIYYLSITALFLFLAGQGLEKRRWS